MMAAGWSFLQEDIMSGEMEKERGKNMEKESEKGKNDKLREMRMKGKMNNQNKKLIFFILRVFH